MATRAEQIASIRKALASGTSEVGIDQTKVKKDLKSMKEWLYQLEAEEAAAAGGGASVIKFTRLISPNSRGC